MVECLCERFGYCRADVLGPERSRRAEVLAVRIAIIRAVRAEWPRCSVSGLARTLGVNRSTVIHTLRLTKASRRMAQNWGCDLLEMAA